MTFFKYQGAGNDFLIADNRDGRISEKDGVLTAVLPDGAVWSRSIDSLCDRRYGVGADGLMLLEAGPEGTDFRMTYFNSDGSGGMMCGNGGRCIVSFAEDCGVPAEAVDASGTKRYMFIAADGLHTAYILDESDGKKTVRLRMKDVVEAVPYESLSGVGVPSDGYFLDTGTRHYVRFVEDVDDTDVVQEGRDIRYNALELQPVGANVNFVEPCRDVLRVRTYEKGVEDETYACGTGIVASALSAYVRRVRPYAVDDDGRLHYSIDARRDSLAVDFIPGREMLAEDVHLTGPAVFVATVNIF